MSSAIMTETVSELSDSDIRKLIEKDARVLGITADEAIASIENGHTGSSYVWRDLESLVWMLNA
jgi:hypothetical protein